LSLFSQQCPARISGLSTGVSICCMLFADDLGSSRPRGILDWKGDQSLSQARTVCHVLLERKGGSLIPPASTGEIRLFSKLRNEMLRLPAFLRHYRKLGVARFFLVDNGSTDGTTEYLLAQPDVHVFRTEGHFREARGGTDWLNALLGQFGVATWCVTVDVDELLWFPGVEQTRLSKLTAYMDAQGYQALGCLLLDLYPAGSLKDCAYTPDQDLAAAAPYFDIGPYIVTKPFRGVSRSPAYGVFGGVRGRVFYPEARLKPIFWKLRYLLFTWLPYRIPPLRQSTFLGRLQPKISPILTKVPLVRWDSESRYLDVNHYVTPRVMAPETGVVLHFKFLQDFHERAVHEAARGEYFDGASEYRRYCEKLKSDHALSFMYEGSTQIKDSSQLIQLGLMHDTDAWARERKANAVSGPVAKRTRPRCTVVTWFYDYQPGLLDFSYRIRALATEYDLTVIARKPLYAEELMVEGVTYSVIEVPEADLKSNIEYVLKVARLIRRERPDLVVHLGSHTASATLLTAGTRSAVYWNEHPSHYIGDVEGSPFKRILRALLRRLTYAGAIKAELVMPIGEAHRDDLLEHGADPSRVKLIYMGVSSDFEIPCASDQPPPLSSPKRPMVLIYTGTVMKERGRDVMLEAIAIANRDSMVAKLIIVGASSEQLDYCNERAKQLNIHDAVEIHGRVPGSRIPEFLRRADAGICIWEDRIYWRFNPPTKLFEYLVMGLPILASRIRTHTAYVENGLNGFVFDYSPEDLARVIGHLWEAQDTLPTLRRQAAESASKYGWSGIEPEFLAAVRDMVLSRTEPQTIGSPAEASG
jgi:glycosyltransferase involved in cell wall biosynthesis